MKKAKSVEAIPFKRKWHAKAYEAVSKKEWSRKQIAAKYKVSEAEVNGLFVSLTNLAKNLRTFKVKGNAASFKVIA